MSFGSGSDSFTVKKFETQGEIEEKKRRRQEHWEKVRKPDDPEECPEEETRSLFQQLEDNKASQQQEFEEQFKLRNSVKGLEEEETKFLDFVSNRQLQLEKEREKEENVVLAEMKEAAVRRVTEKSPPAPEVKKTAAPASSPSTSKKSQQSLLMGAIKRKSTEAPSEEATNKRPRSESENSTPSSPPAEDKLLKLIDTSKPVAQVAGYLPGIGSYDDSSDSDSFSNESDPEDYMQVKKVVRVHVQQN